MPPRATFSTIAPGFIRAIGRLPIRPRVARVSGTWTVTTSARSSSVVEVDELDAVVRGLLGGDERIRRR